MRRNFSGPGGRYENLDEPCPLDLSRDPAENMRDLLYQITSKELMSTAKRMGYVNNFTKLIQSVGENTNLGYSLEDIIKCLMLSLVSTAKEVRAAGLRAFRHMFTGEKMLSKMLEFRIDIFLTRSMDMVHAFEVERVQALRFIRKVISLCPRQCPMSLAACLVSIGNDEGDDADRLKRACVATLCELAIKNVATASYCGGINTIIRNVLDSQVQRFNESLMATLLYLLTTPESRPYVRRDVGLESILAPFTDLHYRHNPDTPETHLRDEKANRLQASKMAIVTIFRSWSGIISLCRPDGKGVQSLLGVFCLLNSDVRKGVMDILFEIFQLKEPDWTDDFHLALLSIDPCQMQDSWKLSEGFVAEEAKALLPHRASGRTNLVMNYLALVLAAFMNAGLFESLVEVITSSDPVISVRATILLGELLHLANTLLPPECSTHTHCVPLLVNTASSFEVSSQERSRASVAVNCLDRLHQTKKRRLEPCSLYLNFITTKAHTLEPKVKPDKLHRDRLTACLNKEIDDPLFSAIRDTQVMMEKDFRNWDWELIGSTLQSPAVTLKKLEETSNQKFVRNLLYFYKPSSQRFCTVHISDPQARMFSEVGCLLIDFLLKSDDVEGLPILQELVQNIGECLKEALSPSITTGVLSNNNVLSTLSRDYLLFLGKLACTKNGSKLLERTGIYQYLLDLCSLPSRDSLLKLIVASLDYSHSGISRIILSKILTASNVTTRLYATSHLRVLLRARVAFFHSWGLEFLVTQLYDTDTQVVNEAVDVLDEACGDEANLQYLVQLRPVILHLGEKGLRLLTRFLSIEKGFNYLSQLGYLTPLLDSWRTHYTEAYVRWVEELLAESLTSYVKLKDENTFIRRSNKRLVLKDAFLPPHVYGQLVQKKSGFKLLQKTNDVELFARTLQTMEPNTKENIVTLKATLWALGHIGCTTWGINFLVDEAIIPEIVRLAEECENYAIRGTCYYVLGLIAKTREGADILRDLEWESVRHLGKEKWPVLEDLVDNKEELMPFSYLSVENLSSTPSTASMLTSYRLTGISESDRVGGVFLGDETKTSEGSTAYDKLSGIYLGEDMGSNRKPSREDAGEVGILSRWYQDAERRRKIATRESGFYDEISGVYLGEEASSSGTPSSERNVTPSPGGILERLYSSSGLGSSVSSIDSKLSHRRNFSEGDFTAAKFHEKNSPGSVEAKLKKRAFSNAERVIVPPSATVALFNERSGQTTVSERRPHKLSEETLAMDTPTGRSVGIPTFSATLIDSTNKMGSRSRSGSDATDLPLPNMHIRTSSNLSSASADNKLDSRSRSGSDATDLPLPNMHIRTSSNLSSASADSKLDSRSRSGSDATDLPNMHIRTNSNLSSASVDSGDYLEMAYLTSRSRASSASETGVYPQQESPTYRSSTSLNSDDTSKMIGEKDGLLYSSGESSQGGTSYEATPPRSFPIDGQLRDFTRTTTGTTLFSDKEERKPTLAGELLQNDLETRQRSVSLTEKRRLGSPSLGIIPETRCSSFHGSTEFSKIASQGHASSEVELLHVPPIELNDFNGSSSSLAEVKILSDKTIVFHSGSEAKSRAMSVDSATVSDLRRERLLVGSTQLSGDESEGGSYKSTRCRGSSFERADLARKLGLKTGDISRPAVSRTRSTSSGGSTSEGCLKRRIVNRNRLVSSTENCAVISGDSRKNSLASPETAPFTTTRDAFGYSALSTLRRQRSFNRDLEAKVSAFGAPRVSPGAWMMTRSMSAVESPNYSKRESVPAISSAFDFRQLKPSSGNTGNEFLGLCLPVDLTALFQTECYDFQGSWPDHFVCTPTIEPAATVVTTGETSPHDRSRCLGCLYTKRAGTERERSRSSDQLLDGWGRKLAPLIETKFENVYSTSSGFFSTASTVNDSLKDAPTNQHKVDEKAAEGRGLMRQEILRIVLSLSSIVASRSHQEELVKLKEMFSHMFEDLCLYCEVSDILGLYKFKIHIRRFIQGLFANVNFDSIVEQADLVVSRGRIDSSFTR